MLKDLDQRKVEQQGSNSFAAPAADVTSNKRILLISLVVIVSLNILGHFIWQMYTENQKLKEAQFASEIITEQVTAQEIESTIEKSARNKEVSELTIQPKSVNNDSAQPLLAEKQNLIASRTTEASNDSINSVPKSLANHSSITEEKPSLIAHKEEIAPPSSTLKISRKQLSPDELAQQKITRAEQALANNDIAKAESLFEDVLLITPGHKSARKQLAALWFGRKLYTPALNLLSQGIALSPTDTEFRMMQARIYLQQSRPEQAFNVLNSLLQVNDVVNVEYQSLRASVAQQLNKFGAAADAYQTLTAVESSIGRWWLGLAVAHDSNSEFKQASFAYKEALSKIGLSDSAKSFVRQRMTELGEY